METPEQKWMRITNPKTADDYGLSMTETELETFEEGREILSELRGMMENKERQTELARMLGARAADTFERVKYGVITVNSLPQK